MLATGPAAASAAGAHPGTPAATTGGATRPRPAARRSARPR